MNGFYKFAISVLRFVMPLWYKLETEGLENVPEGSGYLFVSNHRSNADPILIGVQNPETQFCFLAKQELFSDGLIGWLLRKLGAVAVDRGAGDLTALEEIEFRLQNGQNALIFPEGTRSKDGRLGHFKTGAALIASQTGVPVVPVAISFDDELHFRSKIRISYGKPFDIPKTTAADPEPSVLKQVRKDMTEHVSALLEQNEKALAAERAMPALPDFGPDGEAEPETAAKRTEKKESTARSGDPEQRPVSRKKPPQKPNPPDQPAEKKAAAPERRKPAAARPLAAKQVTARASEPYDDELEKTKVLADKPVSRKPEAKKPAPVIPADEEPETLKPWKPAGKRENETNRKSEEREQKMSKNLHENPAENDAENDIVRDAEETVSSVTGELEEIISGVEKSADAVSDKVKSKKEKLAEKAEDAADEIGDLADDAADAAEEAADRIADDADDDYDVDDEIRQAMMEDAAGAGLPFKLRNPFKKKHGADEDFPEEDASAEDADDSEEGAKGGLLGGLSLRNPFKRRDDDYYDDDEYDEDDQDYDEDDEEYDDEEYDDDERHVDLGKIALILTFVILGIFAIDFGRRLINDWRSSQGTIAIQSQESQHVESMAEATTAPAEGTTAVAAPSRVTIEITSETTTATSATDLSGATTGTTFLDNRPTSTLVVPSEAKRSGCLALIDNDHQQAFTPNLISFADFPFQHLRLVSTSQKVDAQLSASIKNMFNDFFAATGLGNVMVYNTTDQPAYPPYSLSIPERSSGLTLDFAILNEAAKSHAPYTPDGNYAWLTEHAADYGFIVRYPAGKAEKTGHDGVSWHFRYVGAPHAKYMYENDLCLEEYLDLIVSHPWNSQHLTATVGDTTYEMYYVAASETEATTEIQYPSDENGATPMISGDNINGFVVAAVRQ